MSEMAGKARSNGRQVHPRGALRTVDDVIRQQVKDALADKGWEQKDLADKLGVVPATITNLLKFGSPRQIKYLPRLLAILGLPDELQQIQDKFPNLTAEDRALLLAFVESRSRK